MSKLQHYVSEIVIYVLIVLIVGMVLGLLTGMLGLFLIGLRSVWGLLLGGM